MLVENYEKVKELMSELRKNKILTNKIKIQKIKS